MTRQENRSNQKQPGRCCLCVASQCCLVLGVGEGRVPSPWQEWCAGPWVASEHWPGGHGDTVCSCSVFYIGVHFLETCFLFSQLMFIEPNERPLDSKEIKPVNPKGNQPWIFTGWTGAEALVLWPPNAKNRLSGKDPEAGKDWGQEEEGTEDEMVASPTQWTWVWASSGRWKRTEEPGVLPSTGLERVGHNLEAEQQQQLVWMSNSSMILIPSVGAGELDMDKN